MRGQALVRVARMSLAAAVVIGVALIVRSRLIPTRVVPRASASVQEQLRIYRQRIARDPSDVDAYLALGLLEEQEGYFTSAARRLREARALGAPDSKTAGPLGRSLLRLARYDDAKVELERACRQAPNSLEAAVNLAGWYQEMGQRAGGVAVLTGFAGRHGLLSGAVHPDTRSSLERLMYCASDLGDRPTTLAIAARLTQVVPDSPEGFAVAGKLLMEMGRVGEAKPYLTRSLALAPQQGLAHFYYGALLSQTGDHTNGLKELQKAVTLDPQLTVAYDWMGREYARQKQWRLAGVAYAQAAVLGGYDYRTCRLAASMFHQAHALVDEKYWTGTAAGISGDHRTELACFQALTADSHPQMRALGRRGVLDAYRGLQMRPQFLQALAAIEPGTNYRDCMTLAESYADLDDFARQRKYLQKALTFPKGDSAEAHYKLALCAQNLGEFDEAEREMEVAVKQEPSNPVYVRALAERLFEHRSEGNRLARAIDAYKRVIALDPGQSEDWQHLGVGYDASGDRVHAVSCLEHAIDLQPGNGAAYRELGRLYAEMGDKASSQEMLALYKQYVSATLVKKTLTTRATAYKHDPQAQLRLADFMARTGDLSAAAERYALVLRQRPDDPATREKLKQIYAMSGRSDLALDLDRKAPKSRTAP